MSATKQRRIEKKSQQQGGIRQTNVSLVQLRRLALKTTVPSATERRGRCSRSASPWVLPSSRHRHGRRFHLDVAFHLGVAFINGAYGRCLACILMSPFIWTSPSSTAHLDVAFHLAITFINGGIQATNSVMTVWLQSAVQRICVLVFLLCATLLPPTPAHIPRALVSTSHAPVPAPARPR